MKTLTVAYENHDPPLEVIVRQATPLMEVHRSIFMAQALMQIRGKQGLRPGEPLPESLGQASQVRMARRTWPNCMACLVSSEGFPLTITFEEFCQLPEQFVGGWTRAVLELNPHWRHVRPTRLRDLMKPPH
jgi:hypothetical protein